MTDGEVLSDSNGDGRPIYMMLNCLVLTYGGDDGERPCSDDGRGPSHCRFQEEVNIYIDSLRKALADPRSTERLVPYLFEYDIEAFRRLSRSGEAHLRYMICCAPSAALIVSLGLFDSAGERALPRGPELKHGSQGQMGRGEAYYHFAFSYASRVNDAGAAIHTLDQTLTVGLVKFATILAHFTGAPFGLADRLHDGDVYHLMRSTEKAGRRTRIEQKQDEFLDAYLEWRQCRSEDARKRVLRRANELHKLDPGFTYAP